MSRYTIPHATHTVVVGWDTRLETYFARVTSPKAGPLDELEDDNFVVEIGRTPKEITSIHRFKQKLEGQAHEAGLEVILSKEIEAMIFHDQLGSVPPTELQKWGLVRLGDKVCR